MLSVTLDTSCALNFLALDSEDPDADLLRLLHLAVRHGVLVGVTAEAHDEVASHPDAEFAQRQVERLQIFGRLELAADQLAEIDDLATKIHDEAFPKSQPGSRSDEHNRRDCRQLAAHKLVGRELFVTRDKALLRRSEVLSALDIQVADPAGALAAARDQTPAIVGAAGVAVRRAELDRDEAAIRRILSPLRDAYPDFDGWLTKALPNSRIVIAELDGQPGAVALSRPKDSRVHKLAAFMVAEEFRRAGLGGHLLWSELRAWAQQDLVKVYVTVSTRLPDLVPFFTEFGFVLEGVSARRYSDEHAELILAKHFAYGSYGPGDLAAFADTVAKPVLVAPEVDDVATALATAPGGHLAWSGQAGDLRLEHRIDGRVLRTWSLLDVERMFFPAVFSIPDRPALLIPIEERWAEALIEYPGSQLVLGGDPQSQRLMLRPDNTYYCYPTSYAAARPGTPILFYVTDPVSAVVGEARIVESAIAPPEDLFVRYGDLGVYEPHAIRSHVRSGGPNDGCAMALRFAQYQPFDRQVTRREMLDALGRNLSGPQGLTPVSFEDFDAIRRKAEE